MFTSANGIYVCGLNNMTDISHNIVRSIGRCISQIQYHYPVLLCRLNKACKLIQSLNVYCTVHILLNAGYFPGIV